MDDSLRAKAPSPRNLNPFGWLRKLKGPGIARVENTTHQNSTSFSLCVELWLKERNTDSKFEFDASLQEDQRKVEG